MSHNWKQLAEAAISDRLDKKIKDHEQPKSSSVEMQNDAPAPEAIEEKSDVEASPFEMIAAISKKAKAAKKASQNKKVSNIASKNKIQNTKHKAEMDAQKRKIQSSKMKDQAAKAREQAAKSKERERAADQRRRDAQK